MWHPNVTKCAELDAILPKHRAATACHARARAGAGQQPDLDGSKITRNEIPVQRGKWQPASPSGAPARGYVRPYATWSYTLARATAASSTAHLHTDPNGVAYQGASRYFTTDVRCAPIPMREALPWASQLTIPFLDFHPTRSALIAD